MSKIDPAPLGQTLDDDQTPNQSTRKPMNFSGVVSAATLVVAGAIGHATLTDDDGSLKTLPELTTQTSGLLDQANIFTAGVLDNIRDGWNNWYYCEEGPPPTEQQTEEPKIQEGDTPEFVLPTEDLPSLGLPEHSDGCGDTNSATTAFQNGSVAKVYEFNFDTDSAQMLQSNIQQGSELLAEFANNTTITGYAIGCTDTTASNAHNNELAQQRADRVTGLLESFGLESQIIGLSGGEACPTTGPDNTQSAEKRRTTVFLHNRSGAQPTGVSGP